MHELSLCQSAVEIVQQQAEQHGVKRVTGVWLEIGALSCVEESAVRFSFDIVCQGTLAQGCELHIDYKPAQAWCWDCSQVVKSPSMMRSVHIVRGIVCELMRAIH
jgi:hydrogenase nickel incorporation protein HypA/HybF